VKRMVASTRREEAESGLMTKGTGWRFLVLVEASGEEGRRAGEGRLRCGIFQGSGCAFYRTRRGAQAAGKGGGMASVMAVA
jgi:hypothetical protein